MSTKDTSLNTEPSKRTKKNPSKKASLVLPIGTSLNEPGPSKKTKKKPPLRTKRVFKCRFNIFKRYRNRV